MRFFFFFFNSAFLGCTLDRIHFREVWLGTVSNKSHKGQEGRGQEQENVHPEQCWTPAPPTSQGCDFKQKQSKAKPKMLETSVLLLVFFLTVTLPWGPASACSPPACLQPWLLHSNGSQLGRQGSGFALQGACGSVWKHLRLSSWEGKATVI